MHDVLDRARQDGRAVVLPGPAMDRRLCGGIEEHASTVGAMHTDEEWMIAKTVYCVLGLAIKAEHDHQNTKGV